MPDSYVLDSFALMALLRDEPGSDKVDELLRRAETGDAQLLLCIVNYGEVLYTTERRYGNAAVKQVVATIDGLPIEIVDADRWLTFAAAHVKARYPLSYADACAVALAQRESAAVVTGDPEFAAVQGLVKLVSLP